ncbi:heterokaryon incompatibility protein (HET) domain-containing protein [Apiospora hydei]|uniref:Heterokaryon incompatibility protein (HET) domain-containing protein n=1 Tax=Apiospora hydei TaxID=1337664 RepID=A0ABR1W7C4_9PEZI
MNRSNSPNISGHYSRHLRFETRMGSLSLGRIIPWNERRLNNCLNAELIELENENWAGAIRLLPSQLEELEQARSGRKVDLIEVAAGGVQEKDWPKVCEYTHKRYSFPECNYEGSPKGTEVYEFYFVLWVEWQDGIAYRKALGRVEKQAWLRVAQERISVTLG